MKCKSCGTEMNFMGKQGLHKDEKVYHCPKCHEVVRVQVDREIRWDD